MSEFENYNFLFDSGEPLLFESPFSPSSDYPFSSSSETTALSPSAEDTSTDLYSNTPSPHGELAIDFFDSDTTEPVRPAHVCSPVTPPSLNPPSNPFLSICSFGAKSTNIQTNININTNTAMITNTISSTTPIKQEKTDSGLPIAGVKPEQYDQYASAFQYNPTAGSAENNAAALSRKTKRKSRAAAVKASRPPEPIVDEESPEEQQRLKKQRRMIRNRESALQSRLKRKMYIEELEAKVQKFDETTADLVRDNQRLVQENQRLVHMQENQRLLHLQENQRLLQENNRLLQENQRLVHENEQLKRSLPHSPLRSAGVFTFVVLFSFGFLFHFEYLNFGQPSPIMTGQIQYTGRVLSSLETSASHSSELVLRNAATYRTTPPQPRHLLMYVSNDEEKKEKEKEKVEKIIPPSSTLQVNNRSSYRNKLAKGANATTALVSSDPKSIDWQTDTSYFFCSDGETVLPPGHDASPKEKLSIIIPSQLLNLTKFMLNGEGGEGENENDVVMSRGEYLVEINCQIRSLSFHPIGRTLAEESVVPVPVTV